VASPEPSSITTTRSTIAGMRATTRPISPSTL
jgi:hypothetical protein